MTRPITAYYYELHNPLASSPEEQVKRRLSFEPPDGAVGVVRLVEEEATRADERERVLGLLTRCSHDMGFDREIGPLGCRLDMLEGGGCVCAGVYAAVRGLARPLPSPPEDTKS